MYIYKIILEDCCGICHSLLVSKSIYTIMSMERDIVLLNIFYCASGKTSLSLLGANGSLVWTLALAVMTELTSPMGVHSLHTKKIRWLLVGPWIMRWYVGWLCKYFLENNDPCDLKNRLQTLYVVCWLIVDSSFRKIVLISGISEFRFLLRFF